MNGNSGENHAESASSRRLQCMLLAGVPAGISIRDVRAPQKGFSAWLLRTERRLAGDMHPELGLATHVRGVNAAIEYLLQAFLQRSQRAAFTFVVPDGSRNKCEQWAAAYAPDAGCSPIGICGISGVLGHHACNSVPDVWLDLRGNGHLAFRLRDHISSRVVPAVIVQHGLSKHTLMYDLFLRTLLSPHYACDSLVCTSTSCKEALTKLLESITRSFNQQYGTDIRFKGRMDIIPLCVDTDRFQPVDKQRVRKRLGLPTSALLFLYVGYMSQVKADLTPLLSIMRRLIAANPRVDVRLVIAGTGPKDYLKELLCVIQELGLGKSVIVMREVSETQMPDLFGAADVFVGPCQSMQECFGLAPVEAMACGLPQVVADWNGYRDTVVHGDTGFLVPTMWGRCDGDLCCTGDLIGWPFDHIVQAQSITTDLDRMFEHLHILIIQPNLRASMSERSRARAVAQFSYANVARLYDELWTELAAIATSVSSFNYAKRFDQPAYFDHFGHFASRELADDMTIRVGNYDLIGIDRLVQIVHAELAGILTLDPRLLSTLVKNLECRERCSEILSVGQLISQVSCTAWSTETVRRHILFLLKHGRMAVAPFSSSPNDDAVLVNADCSHL